MTFQERGTLSIVSVTSSPSLRNRSLPQQPQAIEVALARRQSASAL
jgi:hypothetical protein